MKEGAGEAGERRTCSDEEWVRRVDEGVQMLLQGRSPWQQQVTRELVVLTNEVHKQRFWLRTLPSLAALFAFLLGGYAAVMTVALLRP